MYVCISFQLELFNTVHNNTKLSYLDLQFMQTWKGNTVSKRMKKQLKKLQKKLRPVLCGTWFILDFDEHTGSSHSKQTSKVCFEDTDYVSDMYKSDKVNFLQKFIVNNTRLVGEFATNVDRFLQ